MSEDTKQLEDFTKVEELRDYADTRGIEIPSEITQKAAIVHIIRMAEAPPDGTYATVDDRDEQVEDVGDGTERVTRPVREVESNGDWRCPFTGLLIWHGQTSNPTNRGIVQMPGDRKQRVDPNGTPYRPVKVGDLVSVTRLALEEA